MQLLASWRDSLSVFKPGNFKLFMLVTLKSLPEGYKAWLKQCWWMIALFLVLTILFLEPVSVFALFSHGFLGPIDLHTSLAQYFFLIVLAAWLFLAVRPSMHLKDTSYYLGFTRHIVYLVLWFVTLSGIYYAHSLMVDAFYTNCILITMITGAYCFFLTAFSYLFILFLFDSDGYVAGVFDAAKCALKMLVYNVPAWILFGLLFGAIYGLFIGLPGYLFASSQGLWLWQYAAMTLSLVILLPITICITTNYYVKRLHEQFGLYFKS